MRMRNVRELSQSFTSTLFAAGYASNCRKVVGGYFLPSYIAACTPESVYLCSHVLARHFLNVARVHLKPSRLLLPHHQLDVDEWIRANRSGRITFPPTYNDFSDIYANIFRRLPWPLEESVRAGGIRPQYPPVPKDAPGSAHFPMDTSLYMTGILLPDYMAPPDHTRPYSDETRQHRLWV